MNAIYRALFTALWLVVFSECVLLHCISCHPVFLVSSTKDPSLKDVNRTYFVYVSIDPFNKHVLLSMSQICDLLKLISKLAVVRAALSSFGARQ